MAFSAADLGMVDDHIVQGERHVARQQELVEWLRERGHPTDTAEQLLAEFEATLLQHRAHRELMLREREIGTPSARLGSPGGPTAHPPPRKR